jgi:hypothetical protein
MKKMRRKKVQPERIALLLLVVLSAFAVWRAFEKYGPATARTVASRVARGIGVALAVGALVRFLALRAGLALLAPWLAIPAAVAALVITGGWNGIAAPLGLPTTPETPDPPAEPIEGSQCPPGTRHKITAWGQTLCVAEK